MMKEISEASTEELRQAADVLSRAANGIVTHNDEFKQACYWGAHSLASLVECEAEVDSVVERLKYGKVPRGEG